MMKKVLAFMMTVVMMLSLVACSTSGGGTQSGEPASTAPSAASQEPAEEDASTAPSAASQEPAEDLSFDIVDCAGRTVHFEKPVETACINFQGGSFFTMCALFGEEMASHLACWEGGITVWPDFDEKFNEAIPELKSVPVVGSFTSDELDVETVIACDPDVAIFPLYNYNLDGVHDKIVPQLEAAGIPVVVTNYRKDELDTHLQSMEIIGKLFGKEERAKELADFYEEQVNLVYSRVDSLMEEDAEKPVFFIEFGMYGPAEYGLSYSNSSQWGNIVTSVGGTTLYADSDTDYPEVDPEYLLSSDPDCILILGGQWGQPESMPLGFDVTEEMVADEMDVYCDRPGWEALTAVKEGKVYTLCNSLTHDIFSFYCFQQMAKIVWPDEFSDLDPDAALKEFFDRFMPVEFSGVWFYEMQQ